ncbi:MAG: ferrous iron transport protein B, partial [Bacteroidales bacterium]|nr:ferrous iron transport protein B [Bacteroidales bacterium]MCD8394385.1 ferrous iron transport protein B [Bacteroidales bacterium]
MRLSDLKPGETGIIVKILGHGAFRKRVIEMGFVKGREITPLLSAPLRDPVKYSLMGYEVSLRLSEARLVEVVPLDEAEGGMGEHTNVEVEENPDANTRRRDRLREINVALIGNPNCGKTSLFNIASGAKEHVGNYSGVTVDAKTGTFRHGGYTFNLVDLPGTYSLTTYSPEERYVRNYLREKSPDVIVNVVDASNLERNLYLTTELIDMDRSMVIALNMYDELEASGAHLDYKTLGHMIGVPIVPTTAKTGQGIDRLFDTIIKVYEGEHEAVRHVHVSLGRDIERSVTVVKDALKRDPYVTRHFSPRYLAIKLLEGDEQVETLVNESPDAKAVNDLCAQERERLRLYSPEEDLTSLIANEKYGFIAGALAETMDRSGEESPSNTRIIDAFVTNKLFGFPIFLCIMFLVFWATFALGAYPQEWIEDGVAWLAGVVNRWMPAGALKDLIADGVIGGVGGVIVFLPNILILYFCISFMEDSGYMARAAFIMDKMMHKIGLHGKSFIPLIMGFGCNVPAIMAARSIESRSSRLITILINPFMSCSARLPIYVLLIGTFFSAHAGTVFFCVYVLGVLMAILTARLLRRFFFTKDETPFVMELPPYRIPTLKASLRHMWWKGQQYLRKMGGIILVASIVVWALNYFPRGPQTPAAGASPENGLTENMDSQQEAPVAGVWG